MNEYGWRVKNSKNSKNSKSKFRLTPGRVESDADIHLQIHKKMSSWVSGCSISRKKYPHLAGEFHFKTFILLLASRPSCSFSVTNDSGPRKSLEYPESSRNLAFRSRNSYKLTTVVSSKFYS